jgi:hypothetical protein
VDVEADNFLIEKMKDGMGYDLAYLTKDWLADHGEIDIRN